VLLHLSLVPTASKTPMPRQCPPDVRRTRPPLRPGRRTVPRPSIPPLRAENRAKTNYYPEAIVRAAGMGARNLESVIAELVSVERPAGLLALSAAVTLGLYALGLLMLRVPALGGRYISVFPAALAVIFALAVYGRRSSVSALKLYLVTMLMSYVTIAALAAPPGFYTALASPSTVSQFVEQVDSFRSAYTTLPSMSFAIFRHNLEIDLLSYVPIVGAALLGFSMMDTSSLVWAVSASSMWSGYHLWYAYVLSILLAPDTFTEFSSYAIAMAGGFELYMALTGGGRRRLRLSLALLALSICLLYASAVIESWLILYVGLRRRRAAPDLNAKIRRRPVGGQCPRSAYTSTRSRAATP